MLKLVLIVDLSKFKLHLASYINVNFSYINKVGPFCDIKKTSNFVEHVRDETIFCDLKGLFILFCPTFIKENDIVNVVGYPH